MTWVTGYEVNMNQEQGEISNQRSVCINGKNIRLIMTAVQKSIKQLLYDLGIENNVWLEEKIMTLCYM